MKTWLPATALSVALTMSVWIPSAHAMGAIGGGSAGAGAHGGAGFGHGFGFHHGSGFHHGFGFRPSFLPPSHLFHQPHYNFGAGFRSHQSGGLAGGAGDDTSDDYGAYADDISDLHFRVQEPFGPGDIGRPLPPPAEAYVSDMPDRMGPGGYEPQH